MLSGSPGPDSLSDTAAPARTFCNTISEIYIFLFFQNIILGSPHRVNAVSYDQGCFTKDIFAQQIFFEILTFYRLTKHRRQQVVSLRHINSILTKNYTTSFLIFIPGKKYYK